jgi:hypothetical protein
MARIVLSLVLAAVFAGCGPGAECVIDTDCPFELNAYCSADNVCVPRGTGDRDAGPRDAGPSDGGPRDAALADAATSDAALDAPVTDAPATDAPATDAPASSCPPVAASYPLTRVGIECAGLTATNLVLSGPASPTDCSFEVRLDTTFVGVVANVSRTTFSGMLAVPRDPVACSLVFSADFATVEATCGRCIFSAGRP